MSSFPQVPRRSPVLTILIAVFLLAIATAGALPGYLTQQWSWSTPPDVPHLSQIKALQTEGLAIPGWETLHQEKVEIGGHKWSVQEIQSLEPASEGTQQVPILVMLRPQTWHRDQPQVDWMDINGVQRWTADSQRRLKFTIDNFALPEGSSKAESVTVSARFLRGWNQRQTYAVLQWYAWSNGGNASPSQWFWVDQLTQWRDRHRMPWIAVSVLIPIRPLGDINTAESLAQSLGQTIQSTLMANIFYSNS
ncbi:cyanoexosortase B system-associated protein [Oscillatoria sp. FACHB-1407]|uniref:cyanoexosortase B system-associated protein n=1 Tax=Oscillatoria sp. FACHB-1407 TaxID=2692847 RepID=UPI001689C492|nr:cyanoexosortase B system-associated protein [Oscillatoria sp. FACHB-1407]MBD2462392.1 cyanoexosortase B system-associated protein [Oscillatoria sp. FACHB-1407]